MKKLFNKDTTSLDAIRDMTDTLNRKERELIKANKRFRAVLDHAPIGMLMTSGRTIIDGNARLEQMLGYNVKNLIGQSTRVIYDTEETFNYVGELIAKSEKEFTCRVNLRHSDDKVQEYTLKVTKIFDDENVASIYIELRGV